MELSLLLQSSLLPAFLPALSCVLQRTTTERCWQVSDWLLRGAAFVVTLQWLWSAVHHAGHESPFQRTMLLLVLFLAWIILRYSRVYLKGEHTQRRYVHLLSVTTAAACVVIAAPRLDLLLGAWVMVSFAMNGLLQHYPDRRCAQLAAHKKFLVSRVGELCFLVACGLVYRSTGTVSIPELCRLAAAPGSMSTPLQASTVLIVLAVLLKTAQVPLHGWLMQVMEAPTPVSALLHAGVVNLGGIVLLRLAPLLDKTQTAQVLLVLCGGLTMLLAGIVTTTRVSIKVRLAWSTCTQMGFLIAECGLGLYQLAVLHLIGHSLYKAHAFLTSGSTVDAFRAVHSLGGQTKGSAVSLSRAFAAAVLSVGFVYAIYRLLFSVSDSGDVAVLITLGLALAPALHLKPGFAQRTPLLVTRFLPLLGLYLGWHLLLHRAIGNGAARPVWLIAAFSLLLFALYTVQSVIHAEAVPSRIMKVLRRWAFHGFYLDESFTRIALAVWPARYRAHEPQPAAVAAYVKELA